MIVTEIAFQDPPQMPVIDDDHVVQALASNTTDHAFHVTILPRTPGRNPNLLNAHSFNSYREGMTIDSISIPNQISWRTVLWKCLNDLLCSPDRCWMFGDIKMENTTTVVCQHHKNVQHA
jgi:hypothetical protein